MLQKLTDILQMQMSLMVLMRELDLSVPHQIVMLDLVNAGDGLTKITFQLVFGNYHHLQQRLSKHRWSGI